MAALVVDLRPLPPYVPVFRGLPPAICREDPLHHRAHFPSQNQFSIYLQHY